MCYISKYILATTLINCLYWHYSYMNPIILGKVFSTKWSFICTYICGIHDMYHNWVRYRLLHDYLLLETPQQVIILLNSFFIIFIDWSSLNTLIYNHYYLIYNIYLSQCDLCNFQIRILQFCLFIFRFH